MRPLARTVLAAALAAAALPAVAQQGQFSRTVFFGDSLSDAGYYRPVLIQSIGPSGGLVGQSTTNPGFVWAQHLAEHYGTNGAANGNGQTGDNYAVSGARVAVDTVGALGPTPSTATQVQRHLAGGRADPDALYTLWTGANDVFAIAAGAPPEAHWPVRSPRRSAWSARCRPPGRATSWCRRCPTWGRPRPRGRRARWRRAS